MKWPWVSRETERLLREVIASQEAVIAALDRRHELLLARFMELRLAGAVEPRAVAPVPKRERDEAIEAISLACRGNGALRAQMINQLHRDRNNPLLSEEVILSRITQGIRLTDEGLPE